MAFWVMLGIKRAAREGSLSSQPLAHGLLGNKLPITRTVTGHKCWQHVRALISAARLWPAKGRSLSFQASRRGSPMTALESAFKDPGACGRGHPLTVLALEGQAHQLFPRVPCNTLLSANVCFHSKGGNNDVERPAKPAGSSDHTHMVRCHHQPQRHQAMGQPWPKGKGWTVQTDYA